MKIVVTGANGQLGSELRHISEKNDHTFIWTDLDDLDLTIREKALSFLYSVKPDVIVNCAAYTAVDLAEEKYEVAFLVNAGIPSLLVEYGKHSMCKIIHISTDYVFDGKASVPVDESTVTKPETVYGLTKLEGERICQTYPGALIIRTSWLYSSYGNNFVKTILKLLKEKEKIQIVDDQVGSPTYAADLAGAIIQIVGSDAGFAGGLFHYANEGSCSWFEFAAEIKKLSGSTCKIEPVNTEAFPRPAKRPVYSVMDCSKIKKTFGLKIPGWQESLELCLKRLSV